MALTALSGEKTLAERLVDVKVEKASAAFTFTLNERQAAQGPPPRRPLSAADQSYRERPCDPLAILHPARRRRRSLQKSQKPALAKAGADLAIRPVFHQEERRIEAHIFIAFLAYCLYVTLQRRLHALAQGLTARSALEKFCCRPDDRRSSPDHGRPRTRADPLHPAGTRAATPDQPAQVPIAAPTTAPDRRRQPNPATPPVVKTFQSNPLVRHRLRDEKWLQSAKSG